MKTVLIVATALLASSSAMAQGYPIHRDGGRPCPSGYTGSGSFCSPTSDRSRLAIPKRRGEVCPYGYNPSGSSCLSTR